VIEDKTSALDDIDPASEDQAVQQKRIDMQNELNWDTRIFDDRQRLLPPSASSPCCWSSGSTSSPTPSWTIWPNRRYSSDEALSSPLVIRRKPG